MFIKLLADCFPVEDLPVLYECCEKQCFYFETLMKTDEVVWKHRWCKQSEDLLLQPFCPSCETQLERYIQDAEI